MVVMGVRPVLLVVCLLVVPALSGCLLGTEAPTTVLSGAAKKLAEGLLDTCEPGTPLCVAAAPVALAEGRVVDLVVLSRADAPFEGDLYYALAADGEPGDVRLASETRLEPGVPLGMRISLKGRLAEADRALLTADAVDVVAQVGLRKASAAVPLLRNGELVPRADPTPVPVPDLGLCASNLPRGPTPAEHVKPGANWSTQIGKTHWREGNSIWLMLRSFGTEPVEGEMRYAVSVDGKMVTPVQKWQARVEPATAEFLAIPVPAGYGDPKYADVVVHFNGSQWNEQIPLVVDGQFRLRPEATAHDYEWLGDEPRWSQDAHERRADLKEGGGFLVKPQTVAWRPGAHIPLSMESLDTQELAGNLTARLLVDDGRELDHFILVDFGMPPGGRLTLDQAFEVPENEPRPDAARLLVTFSGFEAEAVLELVEPS